jgi:hypothetical protein
VKYPTIEEVQKASHRQLAVWHRFLPSPGMNACNEGSEIAMGTATGQAKLEQNRIEELTVANLISERFKLFGGMTPGISKSIGWKEPS